MRLGSRRGQLLVGFLKLLASERFRTQPPIDFSPLGAPTCLYSDDLRRVSQVAFKAYHHIAVTGHLDSLHLETPESKSASASASGSSTQGPPEGCCWDYGEMEPLLIELEYVPWNEREQLMRKLREWSEVNQVVFRWLKHKRSQAVFVAAGSVEARRRLQTILMHERLEDFWRMRKCPPIADGYL